MAGPALRSHSYGANVNDSPYSRILQEIDSKARKAQEPDTSPPELLEESESDITSDEESATDEDDVKIGDDSTKPAPPSTTTSKTYKDIAQIQKKQAWLRGGAGTPDTSDAASTRSSRKKPVRQPGLLERILLPQTSAAAHRGSPSRSHATTRPSTRRRHTVDLGSRSDVSNTAASPSRSTRPQATAKSKHEPRTPKVTASSSTPNKTSPPAEMKVECITCLDEVSRGKAALLECKHRMCHSCLKRIFTLSTTDPQLMPPRCCTDNMIPLKHVDRLFNTQFKALWNRKYSEYTTKHRLYCPTKGCGKWIKPKHIDRDLFTGRKRGTCKECKTKVCAKCGMKWHGSRECENDESTRRFLDLGKEEGWQRCYSCRAMVQLSEGCNHMRCRCNAEFCMVCGQKWKTCDCPWFNLPPELGVDGFLDPGQAIPMPPLGDRIGNLPQIGIHLFNGFGGPLPANNNEPPPPPPPFRDRRDMPFDPLNPGDMFRPSNLDRLHRSRRRTMPAVPLSSQEQEAADEALARRLQEQELNEAGATADLDDADLQLRRRASRRQRRRVYAVTEDVGVYQLGEDGEERQVSGPSTGMTRYA